MVERRVTPAIAPSIRQHRPVIRPVPPKLPRPVDPADPLRTLVSAWQAIPRRCAFCPVLPTHTLQSQYLAQPPAAKTKQSIALLFLVAILVSYLAVAESCDLSTLRE